MKAILPKIKFNNFYEKWNRKTLQSIAPLRGGFAFKSEKFQNVGIPIVRISNIGFDGTVGGEFEYYSKLSPDEKFVLKGRSLLLAMSGATTGKIAMLDSEEEYYQNQRVGYFQNNGAVDYDFISSVLQTKAFTNQLNAVLVAGAQPNISSKEIDSFVFCIPESLDEQSTIGSLFRTLDDLLASYKDNLANYQSFKATMLSKMFPKAGQTVPEIRLDGFEGEWENIRLGDCAIIKGRLGWKSLKQEEYTEVGPSMIAGKHIKNGVIDWGEVDHIPQWRYDESPDIMLENGDIIFSKDGSLGNPALVSNLKGEATINSTMMLVRLEKKVSSQFFYQVLTSSVFQKLIYLKVSGSSIPHLFQADMQDFRFFSPCIEEQQAIGTYFSNLDSLISAHQEKISQLETLKKKLLQDMFI